MVAAVGKTADHFYPGYVEVAAEIKNKTEKNITEFYFYEEGGDPKAYNNLVKYLYTADGTQFESWAPGKAKEGGKYVFSFFLRPEAENYMIDLVFDDGTTLTGSVDEWFKPDGDGHQLNEISLKGIDPDGWKIAYDDGTDDDYGMPMDERLAREINEIGVPADAWYPTYEGAPARDAASEEALVELVKAAVPFAATGEAAAEPAAEAAAEPAAEAAAVPEGYTGLHLMLKNKSGKEIYKVYLFPNGEDKGKNIFKTVVEGNIPTEDESAEGKPHEVFAYVFRETAKLDAMTLRVRYADETETDYELKALEDYTVFTVKADEFKQKVSDDAEDMAAMDAVAAAGVSTDGVDFAPIEAAAEPAAEPAAEAAAIGLNVKNKTGVAINELYIYPVGEDKGNNLLAAPLPTQDKEKDTADHETIVVVKADAAKLAAMEVYVVFAEGDPVTWTLANPLKNYDEFSLKKGVDPAAWEHQEADAEDHAAIDAAIEAAK